MLLDAQDLVASDKGGHFELRRLTPPSCEVPRPLWGEVPRSVWGAAGGRSLTCLSRRPEGRFLLLLPPHPRSVAEHPGVLPGLSLDPWPRDRGSELLSGHELPSPRALFPMLQVPFTRIGKASHSQVDSSILAG